MGLEPVWLLLVYVGSVDVAPKLADKRLQLRVRYGSSGHFSEKVSKKVRSSTCGRADFEQMLVFPWSRVLAANVTVDLVKLGFFDRTVSEAGVRLPFGEGRPGTLEHELLFLGQSNQDGLVGQLGVMVEVRSVSGLELLLGLDAPPGSASLPWAPDAGFGRNWSSGAIGGTPTVLGQALPPGAIQGPVVQGATGGAAIGSPTGHDSLAAHGAREESYVDESGQVHRVIIRRRPDGREERLEWIE